MRTAGQGQAAVPRERVRRRRANGLPGPFFLGREENILRTVTKVERYPGFPGPRLGTSGFAVERCRAPRFCFARTGFCVTPDQTPALSLLLPPPGEKGSGGIF